MSGANLAYISHKLLHWARKRSGLSLEVAASKIKIPTTSLRDWEKGAGHPTFPVAERIAEVLHVPFGYLFLSDPPETEVPIPDLRTIGAVRPKEISVDFIDLISGCLLRQQWYSEELQKSGARPLSFPASMKVSDGIPAVANEISSALKINDGLREESDSWEQFKTRLVEAAERIGILVMQSGVGANTHRPLSVSEFRGFAVVDNFAPLVFINSKDAATARIFTLIHELVHVWIGESGISNPQPRERSTDQSNSVERFCNKVAAEVLVPRLGIAKRWSSQATTLSENVQRIARYYRVSRFVVVRQAYEQDLITREKYLAYLDANPSLWKPADGDKSGGSFYPTFFSRNSRRVVRGVVRALAENRITYREASGLFGVKVRTLKEVAQRLGE
jgi:Predicted Zn peptidase